MAAGGRWRFLKDLFPVLDAQQSAALRLVLIGTGLILLLIYRPNGLLPEYRLRVRADQPAAPRAEAHIT